MRVRLVRKGTHLVVAAECHTCGKQVGTEIPTIKAVRFLLAAASKLGLDDFDQWITVPGIDALCDACLGTFTSEGP